MKCCKRKLSCRYPNGVVAIIFSQVLMVGGLLASLVVIGDCYFIIVEDVPHIFPNERPNLNTIRGLGFFFYEAIDGECSWDTDESYLKYQHNLGRDFRTPRVMALAACGGAYAALMGLLILSCANLRRLYRTIFGVFIIGVLPFFQTLVYTIVQTDLCRDYGCRLGRTAIFNGVASACFIGSGIGVLLTRDFNKDRDPLWCQSPHHAESTKETPIEELSILEHEEVCGISKDSFSPSSNSYMGQLQPQSPRPSPVEKKTSLSSKIEVASASTPTNVVESHPKQQQQHHQQQLNQQRHNQQQQHQQRVEQSDRQLTKIIESEDEDEFETTIFPEDKDLEFHDEFDQGELFPSMSSPALSPVYTFHDGDAELDDSYPCPSQSSSTMEDRRHYQSPASGDIEVLLGDSYERSDSELESSLDGSESPPRTPPRRRRRRRRDRS